VKGSPLDEATRFHPSLSSTEINPHTIASHIDLRLRVAGSGFRRFSAGYGARARGGRKIHLA
jgi:hypothetical protein